MKLRSKSALRRLLTSIVLSAPAASCGGGSDSGPDSDGDGLTNIQETEGWEISVDRVGLGNSVTEIVTSDPNNADTDGDGLSDFEEFQKTDPNKADTDGDSLSDADEVRVYLSIPSSVDSDGDSISGQTSNPQLWDGDEVTKWGTSPSLADTDGDNRSDFDEIINNATNPLVAQVPAVALDFVGNIDVRLNVIYNDGVMTEVEYGDSFTLAESSTSGRRDRLATTNSIENTRSISIEVGSGWPPSASVNISSSTTTGFSQEAAAEVSQESGRSAQREYQRAQSDAVTNTQTTQSGSLSIGLAISNPSELAYKLTNLSVSVFQWDTIEQNFKTVGTLTPTLDEFNLAPGESKTVPQQVSATNVNADLIREFLREPKSLFFSVANFDMENAEGLNFAFLDETTDARTGRVLIDYGNGTVEEFRVATNIRRNPDGSLAGVPLATVFDKYLQIPFETEAWAAMPSAPDELSAKSGVQVLTKIRDVGNLPQGEVGFWAVFSDVADIQGTYKDFGETVLQRGENLHIAYLRDKDGDGVFDREEDFHSIDDENEDSDGDGLGDFDEIKAGWLAGSGLSNDGYPRMVYSDPTIADADEDGLSDPMERMAGTDPHNSDTDGDLILDGADSDPLDNSNEPPVIGLTLVLNGASASLSGMITDSSDVITTATIDWGDGFVQTLTSGFDTINLSHGYLIPNMYTITVTATDERGGVGTADFMPTTLVPFARAFYNLNGNFGDSVGNAFLSLSSMGNTNIGFRDDRFGTAFSAYSFNNSFDTGNFAYATVSNFGSIPLDNFAIAFWRTGSGGSGHVLTQPHRVAVEFSGGFRVTLGDNDTSPLVANPTLGPGQWHLYVVSKSGDTLELFVDGALAASANKPNIVAQGCSALFLSGTRTTSGCDTTQNITEVDTFLSGMVIDDIRIFNNALSASDVLSLYQEGGFIP